MSTFFFFFFFFFNDTATTEIYTLSLHDALPILLLPPPQAAHPQCSRSARPLVCVSTASNNRKWPRAQAVISCEGCGASARASRMEANGPRCGHVAQDRNSPSGTVGAAGRCSLRLGCAEPKETRHGECPGSLVRGTQGRRRSDRANPDAAQRDRQALARPIPHSFW